MGYSTRKMTSGEIYAVNQALMPGATPATEGVAVLFPSGLVYRVFPGTFRDRSIRWMNAVKLTLELNKGTATRPRIA